MRTHSVALVAAIALLSFLGTNFVASNARAAVGRTEANYGVTPSGAVSYTIPIRVTDGINEMTPSLAISYAGPDSRTILGVGFALSGFSYITPCRKTIAQDLNAAPVTLTSTDRFCLDGARLRLVTGTYGADNATYRTELDQLIRVTSFGATNGIPGWFKAEMPNGLEYEYGNSVNSKLLASGTSGAPPQFWAVNKISDPNGNSIVFHYDTDNSLRRFRPNYISYTERGGTGHYRITFVYQSTGQSEPTLKYTPKFGGGAAQSDDKLLERIELSHDLTVYRKYLLTYEPGAGTNKRLSSVQECVPGAPDDCLPPTTVGWQSAMQGHGTAVASGTVASGVVPLDINGDGFEDVAWPSGGTWRYMLGSAGGYGSAVNTNVTVTNATKAMPLEWNSDGFEDLLIDWSDGKWRVLKGSATGFATGPVHAGSGAGTPSNAANTTWTVADADSDGRDDLLSMVMSGNVAIKKYPNSASGFGAVTTVYSTPYLKAQGVGFIKLNGASAVRRPDFDGDGRMDLLIYACEYEYEPPAHCLWYGWEVLISNGTTYALQGSLYYASFQIDVRYGDFNNDGLTDVVYPAQTPGKWYLGFGQGDTILASSAGPSFSGHATYQTMTGDYDGDGYDDLYVTTNSPWEWIVYRGTATGLSTTAIATNISASGLGWMLTDCNGDGLEDIARYDTASFTWSTYPHLGLPGERLRTGTDGFGNAVTFSYLPMTDAAVYTKGSGATYPDRDYRGSAPLVRTMQVSPAGGTEFTLTYKYADARVHSQGRSFLGIGKREITDSREIAEEPGNRIFISETYRQDFPYVGASATTTIKQSLSGNPIQDVTHTYANHVLNSSPGNQRYLPFRSKTVTKAYEVGGVKDGLQITEITEDHAVNTLGNATFVSLKYEDKDNGSGELGSIWTTEVTSTFSENQTDWCLALPLTRSEKRILPGGTYETRTASWEVATAQCRITRETIEPGAGSLLSLVTDIDYDTCGNVNSISSYPAGESGLARTTAIGYGTRCQRPESITNPLNQTSTIAYGWPLALPTSQSDPNGIAIGLSYDGFGRLTQRDFPDGTNVTYALSSNCATVPNWCDKYDGGARIKISQSMRDTSNAIIRTDEQFLDGFGRLRWSHSDSLESGPSIVQTDYDAFGRPSANSQPHFLGGPVYATVYARDLIGRVTQINAPISEGTPSGRITGYVYEGRDLEVTDPEGNITTRRSNARGQLRAVVDPSPGGTTNYAYHPFGELASITDAANNITSWAINVRGFATGTTDPDSGSWTYESNAFGETEYIRDAKTVSPAWTSQFTFDKLSRPLTRIEAEGTTTWIWGISAAAKNIGKLASITSPGSYSEVYSFDSVGRLAQQSVTADGTTYNFDLTYATATGLLDTLEYPISTSGYRLKLGYEYASGLLKRVKHTSGAPVYWEVTSTDAWGHIQDESFGNGVTTFTDFDRASGLMESRAGGIGGGTGLIHSQVNWDLNGNLIQRKDLKLSPNVIEDFYYDSLDRFDRSERTAGGSPSINADVTLDAIGNILWKKDVCPTGDNCYVYHATKKRAVIAAGSHTYGYDANGNMDSRNGQIITYTSYNLPTVIPATGGYSSTLFYGAFRNRYKQIAVTPTGTETTVYVAGLMERVTRGASTEFRHYIAGGQGAAAIYTRVSGGASSTYYLHRDHLGSPEQITDSSGLEVVRPSFGAYGERRDGTDWSGPPSTADLTAIANSTRRGFTGHEHLDSVGLIHMNGRVYEPLAGRFLSRDPLIDGVADSQGPNGYAYVHNNPLTFIDPRGFECIIDPATGNLINCELDEIGGECDWGGSWMAGWSELCRQPRDEFWGHDPFPNTDDPFEDPGSGGGSEGGEPQTQPEEEQPQVETKSRPCTMPEPKVSAMMQYGIFGQLKIKLWGIKVGIDINLLRLNDPLGEPVYWDQGIGLGASFGGREYWLGAERTDPGGYSESDWHWYGQADRVRVSEEGLSWGIEGGLVIGAEFLIDHLESVLPSGDTRCQN